MNFTRSDFPDGFKFGTATSSYQIEGSAFGGCGMSHWDTFAATPGNIKHDENGATACNHYQYWESDLDLVKRAHFDMYRFSISWPRIIPDGFGDINPEGLDFYDRLVDGVLARGLEPHATLYHWDLPARIAGLGGWQNRDIANWFANYAGIVMERIGDRVASIATINEPWCVSWLSHFLGIHAPGLNDIRAAAHAMHHVLLAHGKATMRMREMGMDNIGLVTNFEYVLPANESSQAKKAASLYDGIYNRWFLDAVFKKSYPDDVLEGLMPHMPKSFEADFDIIAQPVNWLGINYYTRKLINSGNSSLCFDFEEKEGPLAKTQMNWEIYPEGLHHIITWIVQNYTDDLPIMITENGMASADRIENGKIEDHARADYINAHLAEVIRAIKDGAPVSGYMVWSLLDNFEWSDGYEKRFGLVHVDFETFKRTPKQSWHDLRNCLKR